MINSMSANYQYLKSTVGGQEVYMSGNLIYTWAGAENKIAELHSKLQAARDALIRQVGDTRECPHCRKYFIPDDPTSRLAFETYKSIRT
jgi:hypothetical protein